MAARIKDSRSAWAEIRAAPRTLVRFLQRRSSRVKAPPPPPSLVERAEGRNRSRFRIAKEAERRVLVNPPATSLELPGFRHPIGNTSGIALI